MSRVFRALAPLRLGLAGGGTDVSPYCDDFGGLVLNATINHYAHCSIRPLSSRCMEFTAHDLGITETYDPGQAESTPCALSLHREVYKYITERYTGDLSEGARVATHCDAPPGSGLGSSSTLVVAMVQAYAEWLQLPLGEYDIARDAYEIERIRLASAGGRQDQYAAAFGGFNFIEFHPNNFVTVNPLRVKKTIVHEFEESLVLFFTSISRESRHIIHEQSQKVRSQQTDAIQATHAIKQGAINMKDALLKGDMKKVASILRESWEAKRRLASGISTDHIEVVFKAAEKAGAIAGKVSGAGGGGFIMFMVDPEHRTGLERSLRECNGTCLPFRFESEGARSWSVAQ